MANHEIAVASEGERDFKEPPMEHLTTLVQQLPAEIARVKELIEGYKTTVPRAGVSIPLLEKALARAEHAQASGDPVAIYNAVQELKGCL